MSHLLPAFLLFLASAPSSVVGPSVTSEPASHRSGWQWPPRAGWLAFRWGKIARCGWCNVICGHVDFLYALFKTCRWQSDGIDCRNHLFPLSHAILQHHFLQFFVSFEPTESTTTVFTMPPTNLTTVFTYPPTDPGDVKGCNCEPCKTIQGKSILFPRGPRHEWYTSFTAPIKEASWFLKASRARVQWEMLALRKLTWICLWMVTRNLKSKENFAHKSVVWYMRYPFSRPKILPYGRRYLEMWHTLLPLQEWGGHDSLTKIIMNITITNFLSHSQAFIFMIEFSGRSSRALLVRCKNWQHLQTIQIYRVPCLLMMPSTQESNGNWAKCCYFSNNKKQSEVCYSIGSVALDWSVTFYKFAKVDRILIADSTIQWQAPVCIIIRGRNHSKVLLYLELQDKSSLNHL